MKKMLNTISKTLISASLIALLTSCSSDKKIVDLNLKYVTAESTPTAVTDGSAQAQIAEAATAVGHSLQQLSALELATHPGQKISKPISANTPGLGHLASVNWTGPAEPLLEKIAEATKYQLRIIGKKPALPVLISLDIKNQPVATILRNITYQVVTKANIAVYPKTRTIELRYNGN